MDKILQIIPPRLSEGAPKGEKVEEEQAVKGGAVKMEKGIFTN